MKKLFIVVVMVAAFVLPTMAQTAQEWQSTSAMQTSGSAYTPQVTAVGAAAVSEMATTTENYSPSKAPGIRRGFDTGGESGRSDESPIGDEMIPLMLLAMLYAFYLWRRKAKRTEYLK